MFSSHQFLAVLLGHTFRASQLSHQRNSFLHIPALCRLIASSLNGGFLPFALPAVSVLDFLCDVRFHKSYVLPPNPHTGRHAPSRVSYADYGDSESNAVVLFCGALIGSRFCYSPLDQLAKAYNVRIIHPDRPGIGGTQAVDLDKRIQTWLDESGQANVDEILC